MVKGKKKDAPRASKKKDTPRLLDKKEVRGLVEGVLRQHPGKYLPIKQLFRACKFTSHPLKMICIDVLNEMLESGEVSRDSEGEVSYNAHTQVCEGVFQRTAGGRNFVDLPDGVGVSVYDEDTHHALPGDRVKVSLFARRRDTRHLHGEVIEVLERSHDNFIGTLQVEHTAAFLVNSARPLLRDILIPIDKLRGGHDGDKAVVRVTDWPMDKRNPQGEVVDILGRSGENNAEMHAILAEFGLPYRYPEEVEEAANQIPFTISPDEIAEREDFRAVTTFTIDPRDAKDFDDAISIQRLVNGHWQVGVHIADVSHYVQEGSIIDREAARRATSIYLVDRTVPMLPERLCNLICSLRPDEDKLCYSVIFEMDEEAEVLGSHVAHTVIRSDRRFAYEEVQYLLEQIGEASPEDMQFPIQRPLPVESPELPAEMREELEAGGMKRPSEPRPAEDFQEELVTLNRMAKLLRARRFQHGAINFDREEVRFEIDETGKPLSVYFKRAKDANKLVEEFMLLANRTVAEGVGRVPKGKEHAKTLPYRIHDTPDPEKLEKVAKLVSSFGFRLQTTGSRDDVAHSINRLLLDARERPQRELVDLMTLRAMAKARYSTVNIGHYGLAFDFYTHFTSPIRRYPDLMVHRLLTRYAQGGKSASQPKYEALCEHCSTQEQLATDAERASIKYKQVEFMSDKIGQEFDASVSGITDFGIYAEIDENKCEGLIPVRCLGDEPFDFDDRNYCLVGRRTHHSFTIGDKVRVRVAQANLLRKQLDYDFVRKLSGEQFENNAIDRAAPLGLKDRDRRKERKGQSRKSRRKGR